MSRIFNNNGTMFTNGSTVFFQKDAPFPVFTPPLSQACYAAIDTGTNRLFMTAGTKVWVYNLTSLTLITTISGFGLLTGVALDITANNRFFIVDYVNGTNALSVIDATTYTVISTLGIGGSMVGASFDDDNHRLVVCAFSGALTVVDTTTMSVIGSIPGYPISGSGQLSGIRLDKTNNLFWCTSQNRSSIFLIDRNAYTLTSTNAVTGFSSIQDIEIDLSNNRIFLSDFNTNNVSILDATTFAVNQVVTGFSAPVGLCLDAARNRVFVLNYNTGVVTIMN